MLIRATLARLAVLTLAALLLATPIPSPARAQPADAAWEQLPLQGIVEDLFAPLSGAMFARVRAPEGSKIDALWRSDDGGLTWREVVLPEPGLGRDDLLLVDPLDHGRIYRGGAGGLHRTVDDGQTWSRLHEGFVEGLAISTASRELLYLMPRSRLGQILHSVDDGVTWTALPIATVGELHCQIGQHEPLAALPDDPNGVIGAFICTKVAAEGWEGHILLSRDRGATWTSVARDLWGGEMWVAPAAGGRVFLGMGRDRSAYPSVAIWRLDGDQLAEVRRAAGPLSASVGSVTADPTRPNRVALLSNGTVLLTDDGVQWRYLPELSSFRPSRIAFGIDGRWLFGAIGKGVYRLPME